MAIVTENGCKNRLIVVKLPFSTKFEAHPYVEPLQFDYYSTYYLTYSNANCKSKITRSLRSTQKGFDEKIITFTYAILAHGTFAWCLFH